MLRLSWRCYLLLECDFARRRAAPATLKLHLDVSIPRQAEDRHVAKDAFASTSEATDNVAWSLLKNPALA